MSLSKMKIQNPKMLEKDLSLLLQRFSSWMQHGLRVQQPGVSTFRVIDEDIPSYIQQTFRIKGIFRNQHRIWEVTIKDITDE